MHIKTKLILAATAVVCMAAQRVAFRAQSSSTIAYTPKSDGDVAEITNVAYEVTGTGIAGRPREERLVLRKTVWLKEVLGDIGVAATVKYEAWPLGSGITQKPLYTVSATARDGETRDNALIILARGLEEVEWWSVYRLGDGRFLFDSHVPLLAFSTTRDVQTPRYAGLEVPPDDAADARLREPRAVSVLSYAAEGRVIRQALITCDDPARARLLRSYWDVRRMLAFTGTPQAITISFRNSTPADPVVKVDVVVPVLQDDLDLAHAKVPAGLHVAPWHR